MKSSILVVLALAVTLSSGCRRDVPEPRRTAAHHHEHHPPHQGTPVELGEEEYHLEFVLHPSAGQMQAFVLDGELENFVRVRIGTFDVDVRLPAKQETLQFHAVASHATGETVGDTSAFVTQADWLRTNATFDASIKQIVVREKSYENIRFNFPKGNDVHENE